MLQKNYILNLLNCSMAQFCGVVLTRKILITFYASLPVFRLSQLRKLARNLATVLGSTYTCEQTFSRTKQNK
jgi:hypothetical protein